MRYEPNAISPNVIGGSAANVVTPGVRGATIGGGGVASSDPDFGSSAPNRVTDAYGTVAGGYANRAGDGAGSPIDAPFATVGGGLANRAGASLSPAGEQATKRRERRVRRRRQFQHRERQSPAPSPEALATPRPGTTARSPGAAETSQRAITVSPQVPERRRTMRAASCMPTLPAAVRQAVSVRTKSLSAASAVSTSGRPETRTQTTAARGSHRVPEPGALTAIATASIELLRWTRVPSSRSWCRCRSPLGNGRASRAAIRHMGPMAQDFHSAFGLGDSDTQIVTVDARRRGARRDPGLEREARAAIAREGCGACGASPDRRVAARTIFVRSQAFRRASQ